MQSFIHNNWKVYSNTVSPKLNTDDLARTFDTPPPYASIHNKSFVNKLIDNTTFNLFSKSTINKKSLTQGIKLVEFAVDEFESGNEALALDIYLSGLDKIIMALPNLKNLKTKQTIKDKLASIKEKIGIQQQQEQQDPSLVDVISHYLSPSSWLSYPQDNLLKFKMLGQSLTDIIIQCVVLFKKSPIPGFLHLLFTFFVYFLLWLDDQLLLSKRLEHFAIDCIKYILKVDEKYHLHEYASESIYLVISGFLKLVIACKEQ